MSKNMFFKLFLGLSILAAAVVWLITVVSPDTFGDINVASWAVLIVSACWGVAFIINGLAKNDVGIFKKFDVLLGAGFLVIALFMVVNIFAIDDAVVLPIIAIIVAAAMILCMLAVGGKKWDQGDNQNAGYKNYRQRKAEEEERKKKGE